MQPKLITILLLALVLPATAESAVDNNQTVLIANYQLAFRAGMEFREIKAQAKVRDTHQFPIEFDDFRILVLLMQTSAKEYEADLVIERLEGSKWLPVNSDALSFHATFSAPTELKWSHEEYSLDLAIAVSEARPGPESGAQ